MEELFLSFGKMYIERKEDEIKFYDSNKKFFDKFSNEIFWDDELDEFNEIKYEKELEKIQKIQNPEELMNYFNINFLSISKNIFDIIKIATEERYIKDPIEIFKCDWMNKIGKFYILIEEY